MADDNGAKVRNPDPDFSVYRELVKNAIQSRASLITKMLDPRRDIEDECGHPADPPSLEQYWGMYSRSAIPRRVCQVLARECWQVHPTVYETEDPKETTEFERDWNELPRRLSGRKSWFQDEKGNRVWEVLKRADILCGVGSYGIILIGLDDGKSLDQPAVPIDKDGRRKKLLYLRVFPESMAKVSSYEEDKKNPRYGQPLTYSVRLFSPDAPDSDTVMPGASLMDSTDDWQEVHWTRVVHVVDNVDGSEVHGTPRMLPVWNNLLDLRKLYGGSAEMYWRGAFPGISFETHPQLGDDPDIDLDETKESVENYFLGLRRYLALVGMSAKSLAPQVVDPTPQINAQIEAICIVLGIPVRVFKGSERGELASSQDDEAWNDRLRERQYTQISPRIIAVFVDHLIWLGILPEPVGYSIAWPDLTSQTTQQKSQVAFQRTQAIAQYFGSGAEVMFPPMEYLTLILGLEEKEALAIIEAGRLHRDDVENRERAKKMADFDLQLDMKKRQMELEQEMAPEPAPAPPAPSGDGFRGQKQPPKPSDTKKQGEN